jgi:hypothetical protein
VDRVTRGTAPVPVARLTWDQVFTFRLARQHLEPRTSKSAVEIVRRLCGVQAQVASAAEFGVATRRRSGAASISRAIEGRSLVKTWAMRGTLHVLPSDEAPAYLATMAGLTPWRSKAWERYHGVSATDVESVRDALGEVLGAEPLTREELVASLAGHLRSRAARDRLSSGWGELLKPAAWAGTLLQGPPRGSSVTFVRADAWVDGWSAPDRDEAGASVLRSYLAAFGPATAQDVADWWARQPASKVRPWFERLGDEVAPVDVEGTASWALARDVSTLERAEPSDAVRLLGNFDQYVLAPGRGSAAFVPADHKAQVSRAAGWISKVVLLGGRVAGVWEVSDSGEHEFDLWAHVPGAALDAELARLRPRTR